MIEAAIEKNFFWPGSDEKKKDQNSRDVLNVLLRKNKHRHISA
jgi:hypothetical protein